MAASSDEEMIKEDADLANPSQSPADLTFSSNIPLQNDDDFVSG